MSTTLRPVITNAGITAVIDAKNRGVTARITQVAVGDGNGPYTATQDMTALKNEIQRVLVAGGELFGSLQNQLHLTATVQDSGDNVPEVYPIFEIGFFLETGELFAVYASPDEKLAEKIAGTDFVLAFDLTLTGVDAGKVVVDGTAQLAMPIARDNLLVGENTLKIHTQAEFDQVFNRGENTEIPANTTIALSPIQHTDEEALTNGAAGGLGDGPHHSYNGRPAYILKNSILLSENVHIIGFNQEDTLVVKDAAETKIKIQGEAGAPVTGVRLHGWAFDGRSGVDGLGGNLTATTDGGAFYLDHCEQCDLNCKIINHHTSGDGGGLFGDNEVRYITATQVHHNRAANGGGAANCHSSTLNVYDCSATANGSGTFNCDNAMLRLFNCQASQGNGVFVNDNNDLMVSGNTGIGTASPRQKLHVEGNALIEASDVGLIIGDVGFSQNGFAGIAHENNANAGRYALIQNASGRTIVNSASGQKLHLRQDNKDRMVIETDGDVTFSGNATFSGNINVGNGLSIAGEKPFLFKRFTGIAGSASLVSTDKSSSKYWAMVVGFRARGGDIHEGDVTSSTNLITVRLVSSNSIWHISADFRSHSGENERWDVDVMFINRLLVDREQ